MFKNVTLFKIQLPQPMLVATLDEALKRNEFLPCGPVQEKSIGWAPPRAANGAMVEPVDGHLIVKLLIETKSVPTKLLKEKTDEACAKIEETTGRKPGKKERREITEEVRMALLPNAFPKQKAALGWIDPERGILAIDTASTGVSYDFLSLLIKAVDGVKIYFVQYGQSPSSVMSSWLFKYDEIDSENHANFDIGRACQLDANDESKAKVRYTNIALDTEEVKEHIRSGKSAVKLALEYMGRLSFVLTESATLTKIAFADSVFVDRPDDEDIFDADVALFTGEMRPLIQDLFKILSVAE